MPTYLTNLLGLRRVGVVGVRVNVRSSFSERESALMGIRIQIITLEAQGSTTELFCYPLALIMTNRQTRRFHAVSQFYYTVQFVWFDGGKMVVAISIKMNFKAA